MMVLHIFAFSLDHSRRIKDEHLHYLQNKINLQNLKMKLTTVANLTLCLDKWKGERKER